jgi:hypothetical protein
MRAGGGADKVDGATQLAPERRDQRRTALLERHTEATRVPFHVPLEQEARRRALLDCARTATGEIGECGGPRVLAVARHGRPREVHAGKHQIGEVAQ